MFSSLKRTKLQHVFFVVVVVLNSPYFPYCAESSHEDEESSSCAGATADGADTGGTDTGCTGTGSGTLSSAPQVSHEKKKKRPYLSMKKLIV